MAKAIVVVDPSRSFGVELRNCLECSDYTVHVFSSFAPALQMLQRKKIDTVVVEFSTDKATADFCVAARKGATAVVFSPAPIGPSDFRHYGFEVKFSELPRHPTMRVKYSAPAVRYIHSISA